MKFGGILIAVVIALAGCSGDPKPKEPQKTTAPTPTSTATPPEMPAQAKEDSPEGAVAFVNYWVKVSNFSAESGDVTELTRISSPSCSGCQYYIELYGDTYKAGGYFRGGAWQLGEVQVRTAEDETFITTNMKVESGRSRKSGSASETESKAETTKLTFVLGSGAKRVDQLFLGDAP